MSEPIRILCVGLGSGIDRLKASSADVDEFRILLESAPSAADGIDHLDGGSVDCIVSGYELPDSTGVEFLETVRDDDPDLPFVLYAETGSEAIASEAISADVTEYVRAGTTEESGLLTSIVEAVEKYREQRERHRRGRHYQAILDDPNLLVGILDADGTLLEVNQTATAYIGPDIEDVIGEPFWETPWWDEETRALVREKIRRAVRGEYVEYEANLTDAEGDPYSVTGTIRPVTDETGRVISLVVSALDVTERKEQGRRLAKERRFVRNILDALPDVLYAFDTDGYLRRWNERLEAVSGYSDDEIEGMYVTELVPDDETERIDTNFRTVLSERRPVTVESAFETKDGERIPYEFTGGPLETSEGEVRGVIGIGRDISERRQRRRRFEAVFDNTYQFTGLMEPDGTVIEANRTALSFGDLDREDVVGEKVWDAYWFQTSETVRETAIEAVEQAREGELFREQLKIQGAERNAIIDFSVRPVTDEDGRVTLLIPEGRDITRLKEREQQLRVTNRVLRHDIRNRLTLIRGAADSLVRDGSATAASEAASIVEAADDLLETAETTRQLNELIKSEPEPKPIELADVVESAGASVRERHPEAAVDLDVPESAPAEGIANIETAVEELIENAIVHNENDRPNVIVSLDIEESAVEVAVADNGEGLPDVEREILTGTVRIDPLSHGRGLGLWYVYWTVHYSGGSIAVSERQTDGSEIRISLPRSGSRSAGRRN